MQTYQFNAAEFSLIERSCIPLAVYQLIDNHVAVVAFSEGLCELFGYERAEASHLEAHDLYRNTHPDDVARIANAALRFATEDTEYDVVYRTRSSDGYLIVHAHGKHVHAPDGTRLAVVWYSSEGAYTPNNLDNPTERNQALSAMLHKETLCQRSYYDYLTGLPNMTYFLELADAGKKRILESGETPAILYFDLSGMKFFNKRFGFAEGDKLIRAVARVLVHHFSAENCSRFGQDHFAAFTYATGLEETLDNIFDECKSINNGMNLPLHVGIYHHTMETVDVATACDRAKFACDLNRQSPTSVFRYFDETQLAKVENEQYIVQNLDRAIQNGWIQVYYQPIVRTANGRVCDEEALSRWIDPRKGFLSPADFIPVLEDAKIIYKLDLYVLDQILEKINRQQATGLYVVPQSLNLSRADFDTHDIVEEIRRRVDDAGVDRRLLTIEITESIVGSNVEFMKRQIQRFQDLGFEVWMDDFGSGYSSLDLLQSVRFDLIKLDMSFMRRFNEGDKSKIVLTELVKMAIGLGVDTVSEGVETQEQVNFLRDIGCTKIQGYYYCKPVPFSQILERYRLGNQIGYENPEESDYYAAIGRINLYDLAVISHDNQDALQRYFSTIPMAIYEVTGPEVSVTRCNDSYRDFLRRVFGIANMQGSFDMLGSSRSTASFLDAIRQCADRGTTMVLDEELRDGEVTHVIVKHIANNPVTGTAALALAVLAVVSKENQAASVTFAHVAKALSSDYRFLFYVNLDTEEFTEYSSGVAMGDLALERHGDDFFHASRTDALKLLHEGDRACFREAFTKENVVRAIDEHGSFTITYRQFMGDETRYMNMKAVRMTPGDNHIIIGVSDVHAYMTREKRFRQAESERVAYARVMALSDEYLCIYVVDPETEEYFEYDASSDYANLEIAGKGTGFFARALEESERVIHHDDLPTLADQLTKENVLSTIRADGNFTLRYRLMMQSGPVPVRLKAALVEEQDGQQLVVGVTRA